MKDYHRWGRLGLVVTAIIWGSGFTVSSLALTHYSAYQVIALRFSLAFLGLLIWRWPRLKEISQSDLKKGISLGCLLTLAYLCQTYALNFTTASKNAFLTAVNVVMVPFLLYFIYRTHLSKNAIIGACLALVGVGLTSFTKDGVSLSLNIGDYLTLLGDGFFAGHLIYTQIVGQSMATWKIMLIQMGTAATLSWLMVFLNGNGPLNLSMPALAPVVYIGLITTLVGYSLQTHSQRFTSSEEAAIILSTESFWGMVTAMILLAEPLVWQMIIGGGLIFAGVLVTDLKPFK